jgi:long-subunit fatty acid transport protein
MRSGCWAKLCVWIVCFSGWAGAAQGAGFELPGQGTADMGRGGAFVARADDPTAMTHNPGALSKLRGYHILYNHSLVWSPVTFTRAQSGIERTDTYGEPPPAGYGYDPFKPVSNEASLFALGGFLAATADFGLKDWTFALGVFGPNGSGRSKYPVSGGQRYMLTETDLLMLYYSASVAYGHTDSWGVGVTAQYVHMPSVAYSLVVDGQPGGELNPYASGSDVEATLRLSDPFAFSALVGAWWRPQPQVEFAASGRVVPAMLNPSGDFTLRNVPNQTTFTDDQLRVPGSKAGFDLVVPFSAKVGGRYRYLDGGGQEVFDVELDVAYEAWSMVKDYQADLEGEIRLFANRPTDDVTIPKRWRDTVSVRLGGTWQAIPDTLSWSLGGFVEQGANAPNYVHLDFMSLNRAGVGTGFKVTAGIVNLSASYMHIFQADATVSEEFGKVTQQRPVAQCPDGCSGYTGVPANAGKFVSSYDQLAVSAEVAF